MLNWVASNRIGAHKTRFIQLQKQIYILCFGIRIQNSINLKVAALNALPFLKPFHIHHSAAITQFQKQSKPYTNAQQELVRLTTE
jgi:hypothetical protein